MPERLWLDVPYAEKDAAKAAGARWEPDVRRWYAPHVALLPKLARWESRIPELLPGEDRGFGQGLFVDLVPSTCWFTNVRSCVDAAQWDALRSMVYRRAGHRCEVCGVPRGRDRQRLEAHERWEYDEDSFTQTLRRLIALCWSCHRATHFGFAEVTGASAEAKAHLRAVNGWSAGESDAHIDRAFALWEMRSAHEWRLDLSILTNAGIKAVELPAPGRRSEESTARLAVGLSLSAAGGVRESAGHTASADRCNDEEGPGPEPPRRTRWARIRGALAGQ
ncbi:DUF5710 domain-containing protein [Blastococcus mobilis]|uniref:DUF5710 domain-containing protein n=1 Tax=Blastococcus mobilis TaxID=1938746 RepID=A0A238ZAH3_9ACTN|nr:DUF5710 domain-containing protein [Blastococcus mobilis]SNR79724.1 hypothetical protein SAMN06272737_12627 [Blastococcus mobilis]